MIGMRDGFLAALDGLGQLEPGHARHADVEDQQREFLGDQSQERLVGGLRPHESIARCVEQRFEYRQVLRLIVDDQYVDRRIGDRRKNDARA